VQLWRSWAVTLGIAAHLADISPVIRFNRS
jgi:hypothetical protein